MKRIAASLLITFLPGVLWAAKGVFREFPLPAAGSEPASIVVGLDGEVWFTQFAANKIGRVSRAGVLTEYPIPKPDSGPLGITTFSGVLLQLGVGEFEGGQIRVTKIAGGGLMWGLLATLSDDGGVTVSPGMNP